MPDFTHVLIEMTNKPDCRLVASWLIKAADAQSLLSQTLRDPLFKASASAVCAWCEPNLESAALETLSALRQQDPPFHPPYGTHHVVAADLDFGESGVFGTEFAIMVQLGFFVLAGPSYQMTAPESVVLERVQQAVLNVASTETDNEGIRPERLLDTLPKAEAEAWRCTRLALSRAGFRILDRPSFITG
jgi:hypothetical protein